MNLRPLLMVMFMSVSWLSYGGSEQSQDASFAPERIARFSKQVEHYLAEKGAYAVILGRVGRNADELPKGIQFTHTAIALYSTIQLQNGEQVSGYAIYNLYQQADSAGQSRLVTDYPVDFFWSAKALNAGIVIPTEEMQARLLSLYATDTPARLHNPHYSVIANPFDLRFQNCTEYTLDLLNAAIYHTNDRDRLKRNAQAYFDAHPVTVSPFKLALGSWMSAAVSTRDHDGQVQTATFTTIARYLQKFALLNEAVVLTEQGQVSDLLSI